jgi:hypothetical protein
MSFLHSQAEAALMRVEGAGQVVDALHAAGTDERVKGVIAHIGSTQNFSGLAQIQELRDAVTEFRCALLNVLLACAAAYRCC